MKKIKVLQMPVANTYGGITNYVRQNLKFIDKERFQFDFVTFSEKLDFEEEINSYGGKVHYLKIRPEIDREKFIYDMNKIFDEGYDVVHLHTSYWKDFLVEEIAIERNVPKIIVHSHSTMVDISDEKKREEAINVHNNQKKLFDYDLATDFIACSTEAADWLFGDNIHKKDIKIFNNAIDTEKFSYNEEIRAKYRKKLNIEDDFVLGHVGRFTYLKNHSFLIDVFYEVSKVIDNAKLVLVGDGPLKENVHKKVEEYGISDKVLFLERREDVNNIMQAMDVFLFPSRFEGLGLVLIEAQCSGLKCISSKFVPKESQLTTLIKYLKYDLELWVKNIVSLSAGYKRIDKNNEITQKGYSLKKQIKLIENMYSEFRN